eukprot:gene19118-27081_t
MTGIEMMEKFQEYIQSDKNPTSFRSISLTNEKKQSKIMSKKVVLIGLSATAQDSERIEGFNYGMTLFITKPANLKLLDNIVKVMQSNDSYTSGVDNNDLVYFA